MQLIEGLACISSNPDRIWTNLPEKERREILRYRGFDSFIWFWIEEEDKIDYHKNEFGLLPLDKIAMAKNYLDKIQNNYPYSYAIYLTNNLSFDVTNFSELEFLGFDIGVASEGNDPVFYSGIVNEIRISGNSMLSKLTKFLNSFYLFSEQEMCYEYLRIRKQLFKIGELNFIEDAFSSNDMDLFKIYNLG